MRGLILALFGLILFSGVQPSEAQTTRRDKNVRVARMHPPAAATPAQPRGPQIGCTEYQVPRNPTALRAYERMPADAVMVSVVLPSELTQGMTHRPMTSASFTVSVRAPHSAMRRTMNETVNRVDHCFLGTANADGQIVIGETLIYRVSGGFTERGELPRWYVGKIALARSVVESAPVVTTVLNNGVELHGVWRQTRQGEPVVVLEPVR